MTAAPEPRTTSFSLAELAAQVASFWKRVPAARADADGVAFRHDTAALRLPYAAPRARAFSRLSHRDHLLYVAFYI